MDSPLYTPNYYSKKHSKIHQTYFFYIAMVVIMSNKDVYVCCILYGKP